MDVLKKCPFCGGEAVTHVSNGVSVICTMCGAHSKTLVDSYSQGKPTGCAVDKVVKAWNNRKPVEDVLERLENNSYLCGPTYDIDGYSNDDEQEVILLEIAIEIVKEELGGE